MKKWQKMAINGKKRQKMTEKQNLYYLQSILDQTMLIMLINYVISNQEKEFQTLKK